jgi:hypothetical protein
VGRDKHENEFLIKYGWPGDVWFHVDGLSSAHVYFRVMIASNESVPIKGIPVDDLPVESIEDMKQIVKHNSIQGCKLSSCKVVWTPHSNLKKTFDMDAGTVTYHDTKLCRYGRCDKDRQRIKELEKTKTERKNVNYYEEMKANERLLIERKKRERNLEKTTEIYDPLLADLKSTKLKMNRQGDEQSGIDTGLLALGELNLGGGGGEHYHGHHHHDHPSSNGDDDDNTTKDDNRPIWMIEAESRMEESTSSATTEFFRARGYTLDEIQSVVDDHNPQMTQMETLKLLWQRQQQEDGGSPPTDVDKSTVIEQRQEETEVLRAIFGEDDDGVTFSADEQQEQDDDSSSLLFDVVLPITSYEPPKRYGLPPPLLLEVYVDNGVAPMYPFEAPVLALIGGGLPEAWLRKLTDRLRMKAFELAKEEPGEPQVFNLVTYVGDEVQRIVEEETTIINEERKRRQAEILAKQKEEATSRRHEEESKTKFASEAERIAYAKSVVAAAAAASTYAAAKHSTTTINHGQNGKEKKVYNTGISDKSLIDDLFG